MNWFFSGVLSSVRHYNHMWWVLNEHPRLTPQCNVMFCEPAFSVRRSAALHTRWPCTNSGHRMMFRSVPDQKSAAVKLTTYIRAQRAQCTRRCAHILENKFCITVWSYCVAKALFNCSVMVLWFIRISVVIFILLLISGIFGFVDTWKQQR